MKKASVVLVAIVMLLGVFFAQASAEELSLTISSKAYSRYLGSTTGAICHEKPVLQTDFFFTLPKGFYFDIWHSVGLDGTDWSSDAGDEIDYVVGWSGKIKELKDLKLDIGFAYFDCVELAEMPKGDVCVGYLEISKDFEISKNHCLAPFALFQFPFSAKDDEFGHGFITRLGAKHTWQIAPELALCQKANLVFDDGAWGKDSGVLWQYRFDLGWQITKRITFDFLSVKIGGPITSLSDGRKTEMVYGAGFTLRF